MFSILLKTVIFSAFSSLILLGFAKHYYWRHETSCAMTFMYELPEYVRVTLDEETQEKYPHYRLFVYGEGDYATKLKRKKYEGIPVLFIPGNSGSKGQGRSLASLSLTKSSKSSIHFDYFLADFNEEFSAFYGGSAFREIEFVAQCIKHILSLYSSQKSPPESVILIGHSMGGVIATSVLTLPDFNPELVQVIYTLGTPHFRPVVFPDFEMVRLFHRLETSWSARATHLNLVSIGGGVADEMVKADLIQLPVNTTRNIVIQATAIPHVWAPADHLCLLWCNQLVLAVVRSMFALVDPKTSQLKDEVDERQRVLEDELVKGLSRAEHSSFNSSLLAFDEWMREEGSGVRTFKGKGNERVKTLLLPVEPNKGMVIKSRGMDVDKWIYACQLASIQDFAFECELYKDLSWNSVYLPSFNSPVGKVLHLNRGDLAGLSHLVLLLPKNNPSQAEVWVEQFEIQERTWNLSLPRDLMFGAAEIDFPPGITFATVHLHRFQSPWLAYTATLTPDKQSCRAHSHFIVPWSHEDTFSTVLKKAQDHVLRLIVTRKSPHSPSLNLYLDHKCQYNLKIRFSLLDTVEQVVRRQWLQMPTVLASCVLQTLGHQFYSLYEKGSCCSPWKSISVFRAFRNVLVLQVAVSVYSWLGGSWAPGVSWVYTESPWEVILVILFLYLGVAGVGVFLSGLITALFTISAKITVTAFNLIGFWKRNNIEIENDEDEKFNYVSFILVMLSGVMVYLARFSSGVFVLLIFHLLAMFKTWVSFVHLFGAVFRGREDRERASSTARLNLSLFFLWTGAFLATLPQFIFWLRNLTWGVHLDPDPSFFPATIVIAASVTYQPIINKHSPAWVYRGLSLIENFLSMVLLMLETDQLYILLWILSINTLIVSIASSIARNASKLKDQSRQMVEDGKRSLNAWNQVFNFSALINWKQS